MYKYRSSIVCVLAVVALAILPDVRAGTCTWMQPGYKMWSNSTSWPSMTIPANNSDVIIPAGYQMVYDIGFSGLFFNSITVSTGAQLLVDQTKDIYLSTGYIFVQPGATFNVGNKTCPYTFKATITFYGLAASTLNVATYGNKGIICGGNVEFWGNPPQPTFTSITNTIYPGATSFTVKDNLVNWKVGDTIVLASTDYYAQLSEQLVITAITGNLITVNGTIKYMHWGANNEFAEVASITRNIVIQGDNVTSDTEQYGGHVLLYGNATGKVSGVEFTRMGQRGKMGRYPFHYHMMGDQTGKGNFVSENSFHNNYQRCFTIHGTNGVLARNNVGWNVTGHCFFLEDGSETGNTYDHNIGITVNAGSLIVSDGTPSIFWIPNPNNTFINNVAVGGSHGFWYALPASPTGLSSGMTNIKPRNTIMGPFLNNIAHSNQDNGLHMDDGADQYGNEQETIYTPSVDPLATTLVQVRVTISNVTSYKNRGYGIWIRGYPITVDSVLLMDNMAGINLPFYGNLVSNTVIIGETPNIGTPNFTPWFYDMGRSRPVVWFASTPIRGVEFYDNNGNQYTTNVTFMNFTTNSVRYAGAVSVIGGYYITPPNVIVKQSTLINSNAFAMDWWNWDGPRHVAIQDMDGSLTGAYGNYIVSNNSIMTYANQCVQKPEWMGFYLCQKNENGYSNINVEITNSAGTNFSASSDLSATFYAFGSNVTDNINGYNARVPSRSGYAINAPSRRGYVMNLQYPTPPSLSFNLRFAAHGEWVVLAFSYPNTANFTITRGYYKTPITRVSSPAGLSSLTYYYDPIQQYLYVMYMEDAYTGNAAGFPRNSDGAMNVDILASCGMNCWVPGVRPVPAALVDGEDKYRAVMKGCGNSNTNEGTAFLNYNPLTKRVTFMIYHNVSDAVSVTIQDLNTGLIVDCGPPNAPVRGAFDLSWNKINQLWNGNWSVVITTSNPANAIRGRIGCFGTCSSPPLISATDPCATFPGEMRIFNDSLNTKDAGWADWSWGNNRNLNYTLDKRCGTTSIQVVYSPWDSLNFHVGDCLPGTCTLYWQHPNVVLTGYTYLQFNVKSPGGALPFPLTAQGSAGQVQVASRHIDNYVIENSWTRVKIPLTDMGFIGNETIGTLNLGMYGYYTAPVTTWTLLFDDIKLVPAYTDPITRPASGTVKTFTGPQC